MEGAKYLISRPLDVKTLLSKIRNILKKPKALLATFKKIKNE